MEFPCLLFTDLEESEMIGSESQLQPWQSNSFLWWPNLSSLKWEYNCNLIESWGLNLILYMKPLERIRHISIFSENGCHDCGGCYCQRNATVTPPLSFRAGSQAQSSWPLLHIALPSRCFVTFKNRMENTDKYHGTIRGRKYESSFHLLLLCLLVQGIAMMARYETSDTCKHWMAVFSDLARYQPIPFLKF